MNARPLMTALLLLATAPALHAASVFTYSEKVPGSQAEPKLVRRIAIDGSRLRIDASPETGGKMLVFHADSGTLYVIDEAKRAYTELRRTEVPIPMEEVKVGAPAQGKAPEAPAAVMTAPDGTAYKKVDSGFIVNGFRTDKYEATRSGAKVAELYVADPKNLGLAETDLKTLRTMAETFSTQGSGSGKVIWDFAAPVPGLPVRTVRFEGGKPAVQIDLSALRHEDVPAALFELPQGFSRMAQGLGGGS